MASLCLVVTAALLAGASTRPQTGGLSSHDTPPPIITAPAHALAEAATATAHATARITAHATLTAAAAAARRVRLPRGTASSTKHGIPRAPFQPVTLVRIGTVAAVIGTTLLEDAQVAAAGQPAGATTTLAISPGAVTTTAGSGTNANVDGTGTAAAFANMSGVVTVGGYGHVGTVGAIRKVNLTSGVVTTLAGGSTTGCNDSTNPTLATFTTIIDVATDDTYVYSTMSCYPSPNVVRKTSITTGATSTVASVPGANRLTLGADGFLYVTDNQSSVLKVDPATGTTTTFATITGALRTLAIASDSTDLWVSSDHSAGAGSPSYKISKVNVLTAAVTTFASSTKHLGLTGLASAGSYLYATGADQRSIRRWTKSTGAYVDVAGTSGSGYVNGTGTDAWFGKITGLVSDGTSLWAADSDNHRFRKVIQGTALPAAQPATATSNLSINPGAVSTFAGDGLGVHHDGTGTAAGFFNPAAIAVVNGFAYVGAYGAIRKVDLRGGAVTTLVGDGSTLGCTDATVGTDARIGSVGAMATDGYYLYATDASCSGTGLRRISLATGATSTVATDTGVHTITVGPDKQVYGTTWPSTSIIQKIDPTTGDMTSFGSAPLNVSNAAAIASDATSLYVSVTNTDFSRNIYRFDLSSGVYTTFASGTGIGVRALASAGNYLYATGANESQVVRYLKSDGTNATIAGSSTSGYGDGVGAAASFSDIYSLVSDGKSVWVADRAGSRVRRIIQGPVGGALTVTENPAGSNVCLPCAFNWVNTNLSDLTYYPVNAAYGNFFHTFGDLAVPGRGPAINITRTYNSNAAYSGVSGAFGYGWSWSYGISLTSTTTTATIKQEDGSQANFVKPGSVWLPAAPRTIATLTKNADGTWTFVRKSDQTLTFDSTGRLTGLRDRNNYTTAITYPTATSQVITDPAGRAVTLTLTGGRVSGLTDGSSPARTLTYTYDGSGNLTDVIDVGGGHAVFTYDSSHRMLTMRSPRYYGDTTTTPSPVVTNHYDASGRVDWQSDPLGRTTSFDYTSISGSTKITDPSGNVTVNQYKTGMLMAVTKGYGTSAAATWRYGYDPDTAVPVEVTDPLGRVAATYVDIKGNVLATVDALGRTTKTAYNSLNLPTSTTDPAGVTSTTTYDTAGNITARSTPLLSSSGQVLATQTTTYNYGGTTPAYAGDVTSIVDPLGKTWAYRYDAYGDLVQTTAPPTPENSSGNTTTYAYDTTKGWLTSTTSPKGNLAGATAADYTTNVSYDAFGRPTTVKDPLWVSTSPNAHRTVRQYDAEGNLQATTDGNDRTTAYTYNPAGELVTTTRADATTLQNQYWPDGSLKAQIDGANHSTTYAYDPLGRLSGTTDPLARTTSYGYDASGSLLTVQQPGGNCAAVPKTGCITMGYDAAAQATSVTYSDGTTPNVSGILYDADGRRTQMTDGTGTSSWSWDSLGRMTAATNGAGAALGYAYDLAGHVTTLTYPGGAQQVTRAYDGAGRLGSVRDWAGRTTSFSYDADSNLAGTAFPNGTTAGTGFDRAGAATSSTLAAGGATLASLSYGRDGAAQAASQSGTGLGQPAEAYGYSALEQLEAVNGSTVLAYDAAGGTTLLRGAALAYDAAGELTSSTPGGGSATAYGYDARGSRTSKAPPGAPSVPYAYDQAGRLKDLDSGAAAYAYDGDGLRASKTVSGAARAFTWEASGGLPLLVRDGTTSLVYGPGGLPVEQVAADGTAHWFFHDQLGSTRALTTSAGAVAATWSYDPYGKLVASSGTATTPLGFAGEYTDAETGFVYLRARYYDPATAQFLTRDPLTAITRAPYSYVDGDPLNKTDPSGLFYSWKDIKAVGSEIVTNPVQSARRGWKDMSTTAKIVDLALPLVAAGALACVAGGCEAIAAAVGIGAAANPLQGTQYTQKVLDQMAQDTYHGFPSCIDSLARASDATVKAGADGLQRTWVQIQGAVNGVEGAFEWIVEEGGLISHRLFRPF
ncbi:MAG: hypothetical protein QOK43_540 [Acidimicrobiaceae bacterium]|nr:hypothetical protein [Acidimicrobiaceae bacterium]